MSEHAATTNAAMASPAVIGGGILVAKHSAVDAAGALRQELIDGLHFRPTRPVSHEDGTLAEIARAGLDEVEHPIVHVYVTTTEPGRTRAWGLHQRSTDHDAQGGDDLAGAPVPWEVDHDVPDGRKLERSGPPEPGD